MFKEFDYTGGGKISKRRHLNNKIWYRAIQDLSFLWEEMDFEILFLA
jgi:hypothetical protein